MESKDDDARVVLGGRLKEWRLQARYSLEAVGEVLDCNKTTVMRQETGKFPVDARDLAKLVHLYRIPAGEYQQLRALVEKGQSRKWWEEYRRDLAESYMDVIRYESEAIELWSAQPLVFPGLLQTRTYADAVITQGPTQHGPNRVEALLDVRMRRQQRLDGEDFVAYHGIVPETVLEYVIGRNPQALRDQVQHVRELLDHPKINFRVIPKACGVTVLPLEIYGYGTGNPSFASSETTWDNVIYSEPRAVRDAVLMMNYYESAAMTVEDTAMVLDRILSEAR